MKTKGDLKHLGLTNNPSIIIFAKKLIYKHNFVQSVQSKANLLLKKVKSLKSRFNELFKKSFPSFWEI